MPELAEVKVQVKLDPEVGSAAMLDTEPLLTDRASICLSTALVELVRLVGTEALLKLPPVMDTESTVAEIVSFISISVTTIVPFEVIVVLVSVRELVSAPSVITGVSLVPVMVMVTVVVAVGLSESAPELSVKARV